MILKNQNVAEAEILFQVQNPIAEGPQHIFHPLGRQVGKAVLMIGGLNDDFMGADPVTDVNSSVFGRVVNMRAGYSGRQFQYNGRFRW